MGWIYILEAALGRLPSSTRSQITEQSAMSKTTRTVKRFLSQGSRTDCLKMLLSGMMSEHLMVQSGVEEWILSLGDSPANLSLWLDNGKGMPTSEICGQTQFESLAKYDPDTHSLRTFQVLLALDTLKPSSVTLPRSGMIVNGILYLRPSLEHHISENGSGYWPTPRMTEIDRSKTAKGTHGFNIIAPDGREWGANLATAVKMWPTPNARDSTRDMSIKRDRLPDAVKSNLTTGRLNPTWVEWLMGFPEGWTDLKCLGMDGFRKWLEGFLK